MVAAPAGTLRGRPRGGKRRKDHGAMIPPGRILVANGEGTYLLKFVGDVRLGLGAAFDEFLDRLFKDRRLNTVLVDLSAAENIDSTSLGVLARLSIQAKERLGCAPTLVSTRPDITRLLKTMGFETAFHIVEEPLTEERQLGELPVTHLSPADMRARVLAAHRNLMAMNDRNRAEFEDLVVTLESSE